MTRMIVMFEDEVRALIKEAVAAGIQQVLEQKAAPSLLTKKQVAAMLTISTQAVDALRKRGKLSDCRINDALRFRIEDVEALLKK